MAYIGCLEGTGDLFEAQCNVIYALLSWIKSSGNTGILGKPIMIYFKWFRHFIRRHTNPIPVDRAASVKQKLSFVYMMFAWNAFGFVCYMIYTGRGDWARHYGYKSEADALIPPAEQWARTLKVDKAKIVRMSGLQREDAYDYQNEDLLEGRRETSKPEEKTVSA